MNVPKYFALMEQLKKDIVSGKIAPGDKLPSENQLSEEYAISRHTVRKALSLLANDGYIVAEHGRGTYCQMRSVRSYGSKNIAVITTYISDYIFPRLIQGIDNVMAENGYSIILKNTGNSQRNEVRCLEDILTKDIDGLIIEPSKSEIFGKNINQYKILDQMEIPYVFIQGTYMQLKDKPSITMDDVAGGFALTEYLVKLGHKKIAGIFKVDDSQGNARHKGYVKALQNSGIDYDPDLVVWFHTEDRDKKPARAIESMLDRGINFDAVVCYNDQIALEVIDLLSTRQIRVPEDVSITGYDNSFIAANGPVELTTISHPKEKMGAMAAELLLEKINGISDEDSKVARVIQPELIIGGSCKKRN